MLPLIFCIFPLYADAYFNYPSSLYVTEDAELIRICVSLYSNSSIQKEVTMEYNTNPGSAYGMF